MQGRFSRLLLKGSTRGRDEEGQALVEYALVLALITIVTIGALQLLGQSIVTFLNAVASALGAAP
jgi:pilus assembly protein Flp/PilA